MRRALFTTLAIASVIVACSQHELSPTGTERKGGPEMARWRGPSGDPAVLARMHEVNEQLAAAGLGIAVEALEVFTIGNGRPANRIHQQPLRWVAGDPRREAAGQDLTHLVDGTYQGTTSGVSAAATEAAIDDALTTWDTSRPLGKLALIKRADPGDDPTIFDELVGSSEDEAQAGFPYLADIVNAGWYSGSYFQDVTGSANVLAFSVSFIFVDDVTGVPTDINGDNYLDTALNEVYYNDAFDWGIDVPLPQVDVETVALHENGHSLMLGHFGPPPAASLNPVYSGVLQSPLPADLAGLSTVWRRWPS